MRLVLLTALGVGSATVFGSILGFAFKKISHRFSDIVLSFAAGIMLSAAVLGLIVPSVEYGGEYGIYKTVIGIFLGAFVFNLIDKLVPHLHPALGEDDDSREGADLRKVILFVIAIAIHNLPEGIAAGVGFGSGDNSQGILIASGIALQNIPEGMVIIGPLLAAGIRPRTTFVCALLTGVVEVVGTLLGFFAVSISTAILPFALSCAGGIMIYIVSADMIPETHAHGAEKGATYALLAGFCLMLLSDHFLG